MAKAQQPITLASKSAFDSLVELNDSWLTWIAGAIEFESILVDRIPWEHLDREQKAKVSRRLSTSSPEGQLLINSFYVTLVAGFEEYLRSVIRDVVSEVNRSKIKASNMSALTLSCQMRESARLLRKIDSPPDYLSINAEDLCRSLGTCVSSSSVVELSVEALSDIESPIKMDNFFQRMSHLGIKMSWDVMGGRQKIKEVLTFPGTAGARGVGEAAQKEILRITRYRNRIAHTGGNAADVSATVMKEDADLLRTLGSEINAIISGV